MNHTAGQGSASRVTNLPFGPTLAQLLPAVGLLALLVVDAILLVNAFHVIRAGAAAAAYPFELDFGEGLVLAPTEAFAAGHPLYPPSSAAPILINPYAPLYYALAAGLGTLLTDYLAAGRALSLVSALLTAGLLSSLLWRSLDTGSGGHVRALAAACAGLAFLQISYTASWLGLMRVDLLAVLFAVAGIWLFGATAAHGTRVYWCLVPLLLAAYTRQTTIAAAAACALTLARVDLRRGARFAIAYAALGLLIGAGLQLATHGGFAFHVIVGNLQPVRWEQAASFLQDVAIRYPVLVALAVVVAPALIASASRGDAAAPAEDAQRNWTRAALGMYLPCAACVSLTVGKVGADVNYLIELMAVVCACAAVAVGQALAAARHTRSADGRLVAAVAVPALLCWQVIGLAPSGMLELIELPPPDQRARQADLLDLVRRTPGPVLSEDLTLLSRAKQRIWFEPFNASQLIDAGALDPAPLLGALERSEFRLVVLRFDVRKPSALSLSRFPAAAIDLIRSRYQLRETFADYWLYTPLEPS